MHLARINGYGTIDLDISTSKTLDISKEETWFQVYQKSTFQMKYVNNLFKKSNTRTHFNMCNPIQVDSIRGNKYFVTFIYDFDLKLWTYLINKKSEVIDVYSKFNYMVERQSGRKIKTLRVDAGGERRDYA